MDTSPKVELVRDWVPAQCCAAKSRVAVHAGNVQNVGLSHEFTNKLCLCELAGPSKVPGGVGW